MEITGRLVSKGEVKVFDSGFMLEEFYVDATRYNQQTGEKYSNHIKMQNANEKLDLTQVKIGDLVKIDFSINGRFYVNGDQENRHSQNINAYKIEVLKDTSELPELESNIEFPY